MNRIVLELIHVPKKCAAGYKVGDRIVIEDPIVVSRESANVCIFALSALMPYLTPLSRDLQKDDWMGSVDELSCQDSHDPVRFKVIRTKKQSA